MSSGELRDSMVIMVSKMVIARRMMVQRQPEQVELSGWKLKLGFMAKMSKYWKILEMKERKRLQLFNRFGGWEVLYP